MTHRYNPEIHNRHSIRLKNYNYSQNGYYFITICTKNRIFYFGDIFNKKMKLSKIGRIAKICWVEIPRHFDNVKLDAFTIMPDHLHGIIVIDSPVGACNGMPLQQFAKPISNSLPMIVNHFKSAVKRQCNKLNYPDFQWQRNYYEHIIHNEIELNLTRQYIIDNPCKWSLDNENIMG